MLPIETNEGYPALFNEVVEKVVAGEDPGQRNKRIDFALDNTYDKQVDRIEKHINQVLSGNNI
jgi:hypothetical protein